MSPRERILATLNRTPTDRAPVDIWCTAEVLDSLRAHVREDDELAVYQKLGLDKIVWIFPGYVGGKSSDPNKRGGTNPWPLGLVGCETPEELTANAVWPNPEHFDCAAARKAAQQAREFDFATIGPWISHFEIYCGVRGLENGLMDVVADPELLRAGLEQIDRVQTGMLLRMLDELGDLLDIVFISDDLGTQESLLISTGAWEEYLQPRLKRWCDIIHEHGKKVLFHTDGAARPFIPGLIASGIDILNPIQHICPGMDREQCHHYLRGRAGYRG